MKYFLGFLISAGILFSQTAQFPGSVVTDQQLGLAGNGVTGTLNNTISNNATSLILKNGTCTRNGVSTTCATAFSAGMFITVDNEIFQACSVVASLDPDIPVTTVSFGNNGSACPSINGRGLDGSTKVAHNTLTSGGVKVNIIAWNHNALNKEVEALEQAVVSRANVKNAPWSALGDNSTNDTAAIQAALTYSSAHSQILYFPFSNYKMCDITINTANNIYILGDGSRNSFISRHSSCLQASTNMITITGGGQLIVKDIGFDMLKNGTTFSNAIISVSAPASVLLDNVYLAHAQVAGFQCNACQNEIIVNSTFFANEWFGVSNASGGTTASPVYGYNFVASNNQFINQPIGLAYNFFLSNIVVTGNIFDRSNVALVQTPIANAVFTGNTINGVADQGCILDGNSCAASSTYSGFYFEGASYWDVGVNQVSNTTGQNGGFLCQGSSLQIPLSTGTITQLPCNHGHINGLTVNNGGNYPILISAASTDATVGVDISVRNSQISAGGVKCATIVSATGVDVSHNGCDSATTGGYVLTRVKTASFGFNRCRNCGTASAGSYFGLTIADTGSLDIDVFENEFVNDGSNLLSAGIIDSTGIANEGSQIRHRNNICVGCAAIFTPAPAIPIAGTWKIGNIVADKIVTGSGGSTSGWICVTAGTPGTWIPLDNYPTASDGSYTIVYPTNPLRLMNIGVDSTGPFVKGFGGSFGGWDTYRVISGDFSWVYGPTFTTFFHINSVGTPTFSVFGGSGKKPICTDNSGNLYVGTNVATVLGCP